MAETPTFGRYAEIPYDQMTPEQQEGFKALMESRGRLPGPAKIYVHNPKLSKVMGPFGAHFRGPYSLNTREREIAVCVVNSKFHTAYATGAHERAAKEAGLPADKVEAILSGLTTSFDDTRELSSLISSALASRSFFVVPSSCSMRFFAALTAATSPSSSRRYRSVPGCAASPEK